MPDSKDPKKDPNYSYLQSNLEREHPVYKSKNIDVIRDKARLYYYTQKFKEPLRNKNPKVFDELMNKYKWNPSEPLTSKTRSSGAAGFSEENPDFYLSLNEQKKVLGEDWNEYLKLREKYGKELNLYGKNENPDDPNSWVVGARHVASFNPVSFETIVEPPSNSFNKNKTNFIYNVEYDPTINGDPYLSNVKYGGDMNEESKPMPQKVVSYYDNNDQIKTDKGVVFTTPGFKFKKINDDGTEEIISSKEYFKLKPINNIIDPNQKEKFLTDLNQ